MKKLNKKGFTLVEMLVVIAIIAVLVAIIIPTVMSATTKAAAATNAANLRSVKAELTTAMLTKDGAAYDAAIAAAPKAKACKDVADGTAMAATPASYSAVTTSTTEVVVNYGEGYDIAYFEAIAGGNEAATSSTVK